MSAYVVDDKTINRIVSWFNVVGMAGGVHKYYYCVKPLLDLGYKLDTELGCKRLAEEMFTLNCDSVEQRYGEGEAKEFRPLDFQYMFTGSGVNMYQLVASLRCFLYQCCEGNIPQSNLLYNVLEKISKDICYYIVTNSDRYQKMKWA